MATTNVSRSGIWKLWALIIAYCAMEITAIMSGFRIIPHVRDGLFFVAFVGWPVGSALESWLLALSGRQLDFERWSDRRLSLGSMYLVPLVLGITGRVMSWFLVLSILAFLGLMARIAWRLRRSHVSS